MCYIISLLFVSLPKEFLKKGYNMALKIKNREEAIAVLRDMVQRKKEMEKQVQEELPKYVKKQKIIALLKEVVDEAADNEGWAQLSGLSNRILNKQPNFDVKDYGYSKFIKLIEACESSFLIDKEHLIKKKTKTIKRMCLKNK